MRTIIRQLKALRIHIVVLFLAMFIGGFTAINSGQDINYDLMNYHYNNPYAFLNGRINHDLVPGQLESYANPLIDIPAYLLIDNFKPRVAAGVLGIIQGINIWLVFEIAMLLFRPVKAKQYWKILLALILAVTSFFGAATRSEIGNTMGDNMASLFVLAGLWLVLYSMLSLPARYNPRLIRLTGFLLVGMAIGLKLTTAIFGVGLLAAGLVAGEGIMQKIKDSFMNGAALLGGVITTGGFWFLYLFHMYKNPVFPFYNGIFHSAYYLPVNFVDSRWLPKDFHDTAFRYFDFMHQQAASSEQYFRDPRLAFTFGLLMIFGILYAANRFLLKNKLRLMPWPKIYAAFWIFIAVSYLIWAFKFGYYRYLLSIEILCLVAIATLIFSTARHFLTGTIIILALTTYITLQTVPLNWGRIPWQSTYFGVTKSDFKHLKNSTILMAGHAPVSFLVPYFPGSSRTIRIDSDLSSPQAGTAAMQARLKAAVINSRDKNQKFYAVRADEEAAAANKAFGAYGFRPHDCREISMNMRKAAGAPRFRLCELTAV